MTTTNDDLMDASKYVEQRWLSDYQDESKKRKQSANNSGHDRMNKLRKRNEIMKKDLKSCTQMNMRNTIICVKEFKSGDIFHPTVVEWSSYECT